MQNNHAKTVATIWKSIVRLDTYLRKIPVHTVGDWEQLCKLKYDSLSGGDRSDLRRKKVPKAKSIQNPDDFSMGHIDRQTINSVADKVLNLAWPKDMPGKDE